MTVPSTGAAGTSEKATSNPPPTSQGAAPAEEPSADPGGVHQASTKRDLGVALKNFLRLSASLFATFTVALVGMKAVSSYLTPEEYGRLNFTEAFASGFFLFSGLGVEAYIQKEVSTRPEHASDFFGGLTLARAVLSVVIFLVLQGILVKTGRGGEVQTLTALFGVSSILVVLNTTLSTMILSSTKVGRLAVVNVVTKVVWGASILGCAVLKVPLTAMALPAIASELLRTFFLYPAARDVVGLRMRLDLTATKAVLVASIPMYLNSVTIAIGSKLDIPMLEFMQPSDVEVGLYSATNKIANLAMMLSPAVGWVIMPLLARARKRSEEEFFSLLQRVIEALVLAVIPVTLLIGVGAELWIRLLLNVKFANSALAIRILAPVFIATYLNTLLASALFLMDKSWWVTRTSVAGVGLLFGLFLVCIPVGTGFHFEGSAGAGAAAAVVLQESILSVVYFVLIGRRAVDRRAGVAIGKCLACSAVVVAMDAWLRNVMGLERIAVDMVVYGVLAVATGGLHPRDLGAVKNALRGARS